VNIPHAGTYLPPAIAATLTEAGRGVSDTDWHVEKLCDFAPSMGATLMVATHSRIVVDLNRDPSGAALYPGASNTEICPATNFAEEPIYQSGRIPTASEVASRVEQYWWPYHRELASVIAGLKALHGYCILLDVHSIVSVAPRFFSGTLPDLNLGTADGGSCDPSLAHSAFAVLSGADGFTSVHNGRFKGGYITRQYGRPDSSVHALQLEMAQRCYMDERAPQHFDEARAARLRIVLKVLIAKLLAWQPARPVDTTGQDHC
jgi:N-formylglutamate deformylase